MPLKSLSRIWFGRWTPQQIGPWTGHSYLQYSTPIPSVPEAQNGLFATSQAGALDTLAQLDQSPGQQPLPPTPEAAADELVKFQKRARAKFITTPLAVSLAELRTDLEKSYRNTVYCASQVVQEDGTLQSKYCGNRWCLVCSRIRTARAITAYMPVLREWNDPHLVTLTRRNVDAESLGDSLIEMLDAFNSCKRSIKRTEKLEFKAVRKTECTYNLRRKDYHPHYHVIVEGQRQAELLRDKWVDRYGGEAELAAQDVRACDESSLMEVFKYFTKLTTKATTGERRITPPEALDVIFSAMRGRRVWQPVGFRLSAQEDDQIEGEDLELKGTPAFKRSADKVLWEWEQDLADWVDLATGEALSEYQPPEKLRRFVDQASEPTAVSEKPRSTEGRGGGRQCAGESGILRDNGSTIARCTTDISSGLPLLIVENG